MLYNLFYAMRALTYIGINNYENMIYCYFNNGKCEGAEFKNTELYLKV